MALFFATLLCVSLGVRSSQSVRAPLHNGFWAWKLAYALLLVVFSFKVPFFGAMKTAWMYVGMVASSVYIIVNLLLLIDLAYAFTEGIMRRQRCRAVWYVCLIGLVLGFVTAYTSLTIYLFVAFVPEERCHFNSWFIGGLSGTCCLFFCFAIVVAAKTSKDFRRLI